MQFEKVKHPLGIDLTGTRFSYMNVKYYCGGGLWLCQCKCGNCETRKTRSITRRLNRSYMTDMCGLCFDKFLKLRNFHTKKGENHEDRFYLNKIMCK